MDMGYCPIFCRNVHISGQFDRFERSGANRGLARSVRKGIKEKRKGRESPPFVLYVSANRRISL
jgi:hypothetical protein